MKHRKPPANPSCACPRPACIGPERHDRISRQRLHGLNVLRQRPGDDPELVNELQATLATLEDERQYCSPTVQGLIDSALGQPSDRTDPFGITPDPAR